MPSNSAAYQSGYRQRSATYRAKECIRTRKTRALNKERGDDRTHENALARARMAKSRLKKKHATNEKKKPYATKSAESKAINR